MILWDKEAGNGFISALRILKSKYKGFKKYRADGRVDAGGDCKIIKGAKKQRVFLMNILCPAFSIYVLN